MKLYKVNAVTVNFDGCVNGEENIIRTINPNKINAFIEKFRKENQINQWWFCYAKDENNNIKIKINEYDVIE